MRLNDDSGRNGIITSYQVIYSPVRGSGVTTTIETGNNNTVITLTGLEYQLVYRVSIAANNSQGRGPAAIVNLPTLGMSCVIMCGVSCELVSSDIYI